MVPILLMGCLSIEEDNSKCLISSFTSSPKNFTFLNFLLTSVQIFDKDNANEMLEAFAEEIKTIFEDFDFDHINSNNRSSYLIWKINELDYVNNKVIDIFWKLKKLMLAHYESNKKFISKLENRNLCLPNHRSNLGSGDCLSYDLKRYLTETYSDIVKNLEVNIKDLKDKSFIYSSYHKDDKLNSDVIEKITKKVKDLQKSFKAKQTENI